MLQGFVKRSFVLDKDAEVWHFLQRSVDWVMEKNGKGGRWGAILVDPQISVNLRDNKKDDSFQFKIPLVRSTTPFKNASTPFFQIHYDLISKIKATFPELDDDGGLEFNNALFEIYDETYKNMSLHTDMSLDLADNSYIALVSFYEDGGRDHANASRILKVYNPCLDTEEDIVLEHNSIILFSTETNRTHLHKIMMDPKFRGTGKWMGVTFRLSKTFLLFKDQRPFFWGSDNKELKMADTQQKKEFYLLRKQENLEVASQKFFRYPDTVEVTTISPGDLLEPTF